MCVCVYMYVYVYVYVYVCVYACICMCVCVYACMCAEDGRKICRPQQTLRAGKENSALRWYHVGHPWGARTDQWQRR